MLLCICNKPGLSESVRWQNFAANDTAPAAGAFGVCDSMFVESSVVQDWRGTTVLGFELVVCFKFGRHDAVYKQVQGASA